MTAREREDLTLEYELASKLTRRRQELAHAEGFAKGNPYSLEAVAIACGVSKEAVWQWENGANFPGSFDKWHKWSKAVKAQFKTGLVI